MKRDEAKARRALASWAEQRRKSSEELDTRVGLTIRAELVRLLLERRSGPAEAADAAVCAEHANAIVDALAPLLEQYRTDRKIQDQAKMTRRPTRGRPLDWPERYLEASIVGVLVRNGIAATDYRFCSGKSSAAVAVVEALLAAAGCTTDPRNAIRRAKKRARTLQRW